MKTTLAAVLTFLLAVTPAVAGQFLTEKQKLNAGDGAAGDLFAWKVAKYVKSNAIVYCKNNQTIGIWEIVFTGFI